MTLLEERSSMLDVVRTPLLELGAPGLQREAIKFESLLIEDVGLDSMKFVHLTVALEDALGIPKFPMQEWVDACMERFEPLTVGALVTECVRSAERFRRSSASKVADG